MARRNKTNSQSSIKKECKIPRIFMQTWKDTFVPNKWKDSPESVSEKMGHWEYHLMTDDMNRAFVRDNFPDFLSTYDAYPYPIQRADAIRYMWLYINGGVYMDLDIVVNKPFDDFFTSDCDIYLVHSGNVASVYTNALMASKPGCSFWLECLDDMKESFENPSSFWMGRHLLVMNTTGPLMLSRVAGKTKCVIGTLPAKLLVPCSLCDLPCQVDDDIYAYAIPGSSWITWDTMVYNFFFCNWKNVVFVIVVILIIVIVFLVGWWLSRRNK